MDPNMGWDQLPAAWKEIFKKNLVFQNELVTQQESQSKFAARYYDMDTYWQVFFPDRSLDLSVTSAELAQIRELRKLKCGGTKVDDLEPLTAMGLQHLEYLDCNHTNIHDVAALARISTLRTLEVEYTGVSDLDPIRSSPRLTQLHFSNTGVVDVTPLEDLSSLRTVDFNDTAVSDLSALQNLSELQTLVMNGCSEVRDMSALGEIESLVKLDISRTSVSSLADLGAHRHLQILVAGELNIDSIDVVRELPELESLYINNARSPIDLACLSSTHSLRALYIGGTDVLNADALLNLASLEILFHSNLPAGLCATLKTENPNCAISKQ